MKPFIALLLLVAAASVAPAQCYSRPSYGYRTTYSSPYYGYRTVYAASSYCPVYSWSPAGWAYTPGYGRRYYPAGNYWLNPGTGIYHLQGYGPFYGHANSLCAVEISDPNPPINVAFHAPVPQVPTIVINQASTPPAAEVATRAPIVAPSASTPPAISGSDLLALADSMKGLKSGIDNLNS